MVDFVNALILTDRIITIEDISKQLGKMLMPEQQEQWKPSISLVQNSCYCTPTYSLDVVPLRFPLVWPAHKEFPHETEFSSNDKMRCGTIMSIGLCMYVCINGCLCVYSWMGSQRKDLIFGILDWLQSV